jgi:hypothetical protein
MSQCTMSDAIQLTTQATYTEILYQAHKHALICTHASAHMHTHTHIKLNRPVKNKS